ncbi:MAG: NADH-quinone oxidoreductase subunit M [Deltaproteobacteria bacterium]|nr:NADH-quinone oxidoreductase subunit M [Deltaproteobacteria bacterium]
MGEFDQHLLTIITFFPLVTALGLMATSILAKLLGADGLPASLWKPIALASSILTFLLSLRLFAVFDPLETGFQLVEHAPWIPEYGIQYFVGIDGISLLMVLLTTFLMPIILLASWNDISKSLRNYLFFMLSLETGMLGAFVSLNLFQFYVFWEAMLVPMYFIIGVWGGPRRVYAAVKFFLFTMVGSLLMLLAMLVLYYLNFDQTGVLNFDLVAPPGGEMGGLLQTVVPVDGIWWKTQTWLFAAFALAFAIKVPMFPLHTWLPDAHVEAPTSGSVVLAGVLLKMGTYGFLRFAIPLFPSAAVEFTPLMMTLSVIGIVYGSLVAMVQSDIKKLVAYSSVAHLGFVMLGIFALNVHGLTGGVLQMVNHGLSTGALFILVGMLYERRHTRQIADFGGEARPMPVFAACFGVVTMSSIGLPMLNGFVGEFLILVGTFLAAPIFAIIATSGVVLAAAYMLWMFRRVMFGPVDNPENRGLIDLGLREKVVMLSLLIPIIWIGVYPNPLLRRIEPSVIELIRQLEVRRGVVEVETEVAPEVDSEAAPEAEAEPEAKTETAKPDAPDSALPDEAEERL